MTKQLKNLKNNKINITGGLYYCNDNETLYLEILDAFIEESSEKKELLEKWAANGDLKSYYREAHALKNVTATIGATHLYDYLNDLCAEMKAEDKFPTPAKVRELTKQYDKLIKIIKNSKKS
ncbi:MAG: Hpt domain-containing protein [Lachnospiraceae bacterium]|nr:Hpt domain-containing protein [Lachnospiraceae bacterium]